MLILEKNFKLRVFEIIEKGEEDDFLSRLFDYFIVSMIILNVLAIILESFYSVYLRYGYLFKSFEIISVAIFSLEYILRVWTADQKYKDKKKIFASILFIISPIALIDLFAILPFYLPMIIPFDLRFLRMLRITRLMRIFKLNRYSNALSLVGRVLKNKKEELIITISITFLLVLFASTLMYYIEQDVQPDVFPNIIAAFWWAVATLTTVGYGDVYPITVWGKILSGLIAVLGIGLVALPTGIISSGFMEELSQNNNQNDTVKSAKYCKHCGEKIND
ncbi:ion transporter [Alkaliphilus transvaalensis]|uniref:ion transporter n=1 Tax=Alkaliphilus transvaalensis TaxID=114628 RepID=UPI00047DBC96|nr:ion transporter [Alkaliphilus transvaalensis]